MSETLYQRSAKTVLVVNDHPSFRILLRAWIEQELTLPYPVRVLTASDADEALDLLRVEPVDALMTRKELPGTGGSGLIKRVKSIPSLRHVPCILESTDELVWLITEGEQCGADYLLSFSDHTTEDLEVLIWAAFTLADTETDTEPSIGIGLAGPPIPVLPYMYTPRWWSPAWNVSPM